MAKKRVYHCFHYFTRGELALWGTSTALILAFFLAYDRTQFGILAASLIGVTSLIFNAKGNPFGQLLMVCFSALYGIISFSCGYYGEMATYLGMTAPMAVFALVSWLRNPYQGNRAEVQVRRLERRDAAWMLTLTVAVTAVFYFILAALHTNRLIPSTLSVATSFLAAFLTFRRSALFAAAYAANDLVLIGLWVLAAQNDPANWSMAICFAMFFCNDLYGFVSWRRRQRQQEMQKQKEEEATCFEP